jgi:sugar lactone lactonase YvrE
LTGRVVARELYLPEALQWHDGTLWFADRYGGTVSRLGEAGVEVVTRMPGRPGGLGWTPDGTLLVVAMERRSLMSVSPGGNLRPYADLSLLMPAFANGLAVDRLGRAYVGNFGFDDEAGEIPEPTRLVRVDPDGSVHVEEPELVSPSGPILLDDGRTMVLAETFADRLTELQVGEDGRLDEPRTIAELPEGSGPEGIACDAAGRIWVACAFAGRAVAIRRDGGVDGGPDGRTLFLGIASRDVGDAARTPNGRIEAFEI